MADDAEEVAETEAESQVLLCTHLAEIFTENLLPESGHVKCYTMSMLKPDNKCTEGDEIIFLYRLVPRHASLSYGVPSGVIERAVSVLEDLKLKRRINRFNCPPLLAKDQQYKDTISLLLGFDAKKGDLTKFFQEICSVPL